MSHLIKNTLALLLLILLTSMIVEGQTAGPKWHPGHYMFVMKNDLTKEMLTVPNFRGVQKVFVWSDFEKRKGEYDFSALKADLEMARKYDRQIIVQFSYRKFFSKNRSIPDYIQGPEYGGGFYEISEPVLWNSNVMARFAAVLQAFGKEFDMDPNLEAVNLPESAIGPEKQMNQLANNPEKGMQPYSDVEYLAALKVEMSSIRKAFPNTVVIKYMNFPVTIITELSDYAKEIGVGMGGPDIYPRDEGRLSDPVTGVYRLYDKLAGTVPMGAAVQKENYSLALKKGSSWGKVHLGPIKPGDEVPWPVREHLALAQNTLKLNYVFWSMQPPNCFENAVKMLSEPDLINDPAGGLFTNLPPKAFLKNYNKRE